MCLEMRTLTVTFITTIMGASVISLNRGLSGLPLLRLLCHQISLGRKGLQHLLLLSVFDQDSGLHLVELSLDRRKVDGMAGC